MPRGDQFFRDRDFHNIFLQNPLLRQQFPGLMWIGGVRFDRRMTFKKQVNQNFENSRNSVHKAKKDLNFKI